MPPTLWTTADCLTRVRRYLRQPTTSDFPVDADIYAALAEAENEVKRRILPVCPWLILQAPTAMSSSDSGLTWTFGNDSDGNAISPLGAYAIYRQRSDIPDFPLQRGVDYQDEGIRIRMPNNRASSIQWPDASTPWFYGNLPTVTIGSSNEPTLVPVDRRELLVWGACARVGIMLDRDVSEFERKYAEGIQDWITSAQTASANPGALLAQRAVVPPRFKVWQSPYQPGWWGA